ncbi:MAG: hypothetical protein WA637_23220 [Terriglobales bacterium]
MSEMASVREIYETIAVCADDAFFLDIAGINNLSGMNAGQKVKITPCGNLRISAMLDVHVAIGSFCTLDAYADVLPHMQEDAAARNRGSALGTGGIMAA